MKCFNVSLYSLFLILYFSFELAGSQLNVAGDNTGNGGDGDLLIAHCSALTFLVFYHVYKEIMLLSGMLLYTTAER